MTVEQPVLNCVKIVGIVGSYKEKYHCEGRLYVKEITESFI